MMGQKERCFTPLVKVSLEELVPQDHFYRHVERTFDLSFVRQFVQETYAVVGRPSIDPVVFFKLQLVMFFEGIRSERQLMGHAADRLSVRWYLDYDLNEALPDHSSLTRIRERYGVEVFRRFFDAIVEQCQQEKLVWGKELYIDSTQVNANADLDSLTPRFAVEAREAIHEHLSALFPPDPPLLEQLESSSSQTPLPEPHSEGHFCLEPKPLPFVLSQAQHEELATENTARHDWIEQEGRQQREVHGLYQRTSDFKVSTTDPDATPMRLKGGGTHLGYHTHYVVDGGKARIILQVVVTPSEVIENIKALEDAGIRAYVPLPNWEERYEVWSASHFRYEAQADQYRCPQGQILQRVGVVNPDGRQLYRAPASICNDCPVKVQCTTSNQARRGYRHVGEEYLERVRTYQQTPAYQKAMRKRKVWLEPLFAEAKDWHGLRRFRLRLLWRVNIPTNCATRCTKQ